MNKEVITLSVFFVRILLLILLTSTGVWPVMAQAHPVESVPLAPVQAAEFGHVPLSLIPNVGQTDPALRLTMVS